MQRPGIAANEQPAALDQRPQFRQIELAEIQHPAQPRAERLPGRGRDAAAASRSDGPELSTIRRPASRRQPGRPGGKCRLRPASERIAGADMHHDQLVSRA